MDRRFKELTERLEAAEEKIERQAEIIKKQRATNIGNKKGGYDI